MDRTPERFAYRCLPLVIANQSGWDVLCPATVAASWDGGAGLGAVRVQSLRGEAEGVASSHFGSGVLTFTLGWLFRTPPGFVLWCKGPANAPRDAISPLEGVIETDWSPYPFTMNWKFTRPGAVMFRRGDPVCTIVPYPRGLLASFKPEVASIVDAPEDLRRDYAAWRDSRSAFLAGLEVADSEERRRKWQRAYMLGAYPDGRTFPGHETKLELREFCDP